MLPKKYRINKSNFENIFKKGERFDSQNFFLKTADLSTFSQKRGDFSPRFSFVVSVKVAKMAVVRSKLKRRARAIVYKLLPNIKKNTAIIFFFKPGAEKLKFAELEVEIKESLGYAIPKLG